MTKIRKGHAPAQLSRIQFHDRFTLSFKDPLFAPEEGALARVENVAWKAYKDSRKAPVTRRAGKGYADPEYKFEWSGTRALSAPDTKLSSPRPK
jgi:hypothetical protein